MDKLTEKYKFDDELRFAYQIVTCRFAYSVNHLFFFHLVKYSLKELKWFLKMKEC